MEGGRGMGKGKGNGQLSRFEKKRFEKKMFWILGSLILASKNIGCD